VNSQEEESINKEKVPEASLKEEEPIVCVEKAEEIIEQV
jgi:hypothetical protein